MKQIIREGKGCWSQLRSELAFKDWFEERVGKSKTDFQLFNLLFILLHDNHFKGPLSQLYNRPNY